MAGIIAEGKDPTPCLCLIVGIKDPSTGNRICIEPGRSDQQ
ncbi:MAG TPA: hypothetical protein PK317_04935 [Coprothermobacter proteolyticus]|nr:hypothetical protein [Coprothermobacter proteolyticus]